MMTSDILLSVINIKYNMPKYNWEEIAKHTEQEDCWIVISNKVIDVTSFLKSHPGGRWIILEYAGKDATQAF